MPSTLSILNKVVADFPDLQFAASDDFRWLPEQNTIFYVSGSKEPALLLHELAHALLNHTTYPRDISLLKIERQAWAHARKNLAPRYDVEITDDMVNQSLDSYREWLHARSTCPSCNATGLQSGTKTYKCLACGTEWNVNEARQCGLRRYTLSNK